ncbi:hypothetical protein SAMN05421682_10633 [Chryseobacterium indoltheticum]|uniref:Uncharacterized protein n=1 Tax=Chryseobacterium indoltheticum TaxID=254 RepID=A0A381F530_9FLAO|nr:hypothetical protein SAMN05421682_10633 [Chryseobacterium indoltheticum]SUX41607.1 Uncharacterised protein [Chryseobacterium indoltheticum]
MLIRFHCNFELQHFFLAFLMINLVSKNDKKMICKLVVNVMFSTIKKLLFCKNIFNILINIREMSLIFHINSNTTRTTDRLLSQSQRIFVSEN